MTSTNMLFDADPSDAGGGNPVFKWFNERCDNWDMSNVTDMTCEFVLEQSELRKESYDICTAVARDLERTGNSRKQRSFAHACLRRCASPLPTRVRADSKFRGKRYSNPDCKTKRD